MNTKNMSERKRTTASACNFHDTIGGGCNGDDPTSMLALGGDLSGSNAVNLVC